MFGMAFTLYFWSRTVFLCLLMLLIRVFHLL